MTTASRLRCRRRRRSRAAGGRACSAAGDSRSAPWPLHLLTPTFALSDPPRPTPGQVPGSRPPEQRWQNPLRRAGVALVGANQRAADAEGGLLTARDLAAMDLSQTQLVTLALGDTHAA